MFDALLCRNLLGPTPLPNPPDLPPAAGWLKLRYRNVFARQGKECQCHKLTARTAWFKYCKMLTHAWYKSGRGTDQAAGTDLEGSAELQFQTNSSKSVALDACAVGQKVRKLVDMIG